MTLKAVTVKRALISVSDKACLEDLVRVLSTYGVEILATGGTAEKLKRLGISYRSVEDVTGNPEAFDGRMKTISFQLESAILFDRGNPSHVEQARKLKIEPIDMVVCNFYPFEEAVAKGMSEESLIQEIDVGGPTMVRAAAKNFSNVVVITDPSDYRFVCAELRTLSGRVSVETSRALAVKAFERTMVYDQAIFESFAKRPLRYGENPHQRGYFVPDQPILGELNGMDWQLIEGAGIDLSYNNILDAQAAYGAVRDIRDLAGAGHGAVAIVKHNNPCGLATAPTIDEAFCRAWAGDPVSAFGGVVAFSSLLTVECARLFEEKFVEVILAPGFEEGAIALLRARKKKLRILKINSFETQSVKPSDFTRTRVEGGTLVQELDLGIHEEFKSVTEKKFPKAHHLLAKFGVVACKWIKSNAIAIVRICEDGGFQMIGMGSGQPNRIDAIRRLAAPKAIEVLKKEGADQIESILSTSILVSDAFFPFADSIEEIHKCGIRYVVQPGGSIRDSEVIESCNRLGVAMVFTGKRHFRH